jgi:hypothetical protein
LRVLISTGKVSDREPWRILEVAQGQSPDAMAMRVSKEIKRLHEPAQALLPFTLNASGTSEWIVQHIYVRGLNGSLPKIAHLPGIEFTRKELAPAEWIESLMEVEKRNLLPDVGDFVRILAGPCSGLCGRVADRSSQLSVQVRMRTKTVTVKSSASNLQVIPCPSDLFS